MNADVLNIGLSFLEGFALIISPCILPILPIILSGSLEGNKSRPLGIIVGFVLAFSLVTLFSNYIVTLTQLDPNIIRNLSFILLLLLGLMMMSTFLSEKFTTFTQHLMSFGGSIQSANNPESGFGGGILFGTLVGIIWTPCAGPILAAVVIQSVLQQTTIGSVLIVIAFAIGAGIPMLFIALLGRRIVSHFSFFRDHSQLFRKIIGLIIILSVIFLVYSNNVTPTIAVTTPNGPATSLINPLDQPFAAPAIDASASWINSPPLKLSDLKGKVVLIDFWTYSCINCIRTMPYLKAWYEKYHDKGLVIIGVHAPEFEFEKSMDNVKAAVEKFGIHYPVVLDNQFITWRNYRNQYWPAHYLIDKSGNVVNEHFGEGAYEATENNIQYLLGISMPTVKEKTEQRFYNQTPETYLGYARADFNGNPATITRNKSAKYSYPAVLAQNQWALNGEWTIDADKITAMQKGASIKLHYNARQVYAVMGPTQGPVKVLLHLNGKLITKDKGADVANSQIDVIQNRLYSLIDTKGSEGDLELTAMSPGLEVYTFTFG